MISLLLLATMPLMAASPNEAAAMRWERRILLISAPSAQDAGLVAQRRAIAGWKVQGEARDVSLIEVVGQHVAGATDRANALRRKYRLPAEAFTAVLIGKDGGEKLRSARPIPVDVLEKTIDAMPMRRAGQR